MSLKPIKILQETPHSCVVLVQHEPTGDHWVLKATKKHLYYQDELNCFRNLNFVHSNFVNIKATWETKEACYMLMEYAPLGDMYQQIVSESTMSLGLKIDCVVQTAMGLLDLHSLNFAHMDVSPENILCFENNRFGLCDLQLLKPRWGSYQSPVGKLPYCAPELYAGTKPYMDLAKCDVFSLGVCMVVFINGTYPFKMTSETHCERWKEFKETGTLKLKDNTFLSLVLCMLNPDPWKRISMPRVLEALVILRDQNKY